MLNHPSATVFAVANTCGSDTCNSVTSSVAHHSLQLQCETSNAAAAAAAAAAGSSNIGNVCSTNDTGQLCRQNQTTPWSLMNVFPQPSAHAATSSRGTFFNEPSSLMHMRYGGNEEIGKEQQMNPAFYQFQDLDMIASIVAKEQAMLKMSAGEHSRLGGLSLAQHHTQVIVNGTRENLSESPSEISPTSCSPSSSEIVRGGNRRPNLRGLANGGGANAGSSHRHDSGDVSPIDVTGLLGNQEPSFDMSGILGINSISQMQNAGLGAGTSSDHLFSSTASMNTLASLYQSRQEHKAPGGSNTCTASQLQSPTSTSASSMAQNAGRSRHRSTPHDGLMKCQYCPKKWSDQNMLRTHMDECRLARMHECQQCGKRFKARGGLQQHMRIHSNDRPYQCHYCPKRFTQKSHVDQHERIHTGAKPFPCQYCGRAFRQRSQQMGHEATHNNGVLAVATNMANQQQQQQLQDVDSSIGSNGDQASSTNLGGHVAKSRAIGQQQLLGNSGGVGDRLLASTGNGMVAQNAVSSLLALSQSGNMPIQQQTQTLADVIASRGGHV